jgi:hypothetical protein
MNNVREFGKFQILTIQLLAVSFVLFFCFFLNVIRIESQTKLSEDAWLKSFVKIIMPFSLRLFFIIFLLFLKIFFKFFLIFF